MSGNDSMNNTEDGAGEQETFHIYILSFAYGLMMLVLVGHFVWRCQWRRVSLSRFKSHVPGDKAFKSMRIRERLIHDFGFIESLRPDPRLISDNCDPTMLGRCKEGSTVPTHWYRMKAFDEAADFVSANLHVVLELSSSPSSPSTLALPEFLSQLHVQGSLAEGEGQSAANGASLVDQCSDLYNRARHKDGEFGEPQFEEFSSLLKQLQNMISSHTGTTTTVRPRHSSRRHGTDPSSTHSIPELKEEPQRIASVGSEIIIGYGRHQHLHEQLSLEPLIATSPDTLHLLSSSSSSWEDTSATAAAIKLSKSVTATTTPSRETSTPSRSSQRRPPPLEMSPLIMDMDSDTPTGGDEEDTDVFTRSGRGGVPYVPPETPV